MDKPTRPTAQTPDAVRRLLVVGGVLLFVGLMAGILPVVESNGVKCGSGFAADSSAVEAEVRSMEIENGIPVTEDGCDGARATARTFAFVGLGAGGVVLVGCWILAGASRREE